MIPPDEPVLTPYFRVVVRVEDYDPEEIGTIEASDHPDVPVGTAVRAAYHQEVEETGELDVYQLDIGAKCYKAYPDERDPQWSRFRLVLHVIEPWPPHLGTI